MIAAFRLEMTRVAERAHWRRGFMCSSFCSLVLMLLYVALAPAIAHFQASQKAGRIRAVKCRLH